MHYKDGTRRNRLASYRNASMKHILWEHNPCINQDITVTVPDEHAIHADFPKAADWEDPEGRTIHPFVELLHLSLD